MQNQTHTSTNEASLVSQILEIMEYVSNQRVFLVGKPLMNQFNSLICGYTQENFGDLIQKKIRKDKND